MLTVGIHGVPDPKGQSGSHDHGIAIMREGSVVYCQELERHTRNKHDGSLTEHIEDLLGPQLAQNQLTQFVLTNSFLGSNLSSSNGMLTIEGTQGLDVPVIIAECAGRLQIDGEHREARYFTICHEMAHLGTCLPFFGPFAPNSLLVHIDGGASQSCASVWHFDGNELVCVDYGWHEGLKGAVNNFNDSLLSSRILGIKLSEHLAMPGKLMGLASYGTADVDVTAWLAHRDWLRSKPQDTNVMAEKIRRSLPNAAFARFSSRDPGCHTIAACMQRHLEEEVLAYIRAWRDTTGANHLCYSGGAALNIHANVRIERELGFNSVRIPPAPSDTGLALGAAAFLEWHSGQTIQKHHPFLNNSPAGEPEVQPVSRVPVLHSVREVSRAIEDGRIIGVWTGNSEIGPRALGHRCILARPDSPPLRRRLSEQVKQREWYRPVAPMMLADVAAKALLGYRPGSHLGKYMLGAWEVADTHTTDFRGCIHTDGTVRAQVVHADSPELGHMFQLLEELRTTSGILGVVNTSFNRRGRPIVHRFAEAMEEAAEMGLDALWLPDADSKKFSKLL